MSITIREIAELAGVSTGTVDRALHNRGRVNPEIARRIKDIANEHGYEPSRAARALALNKNPVKIGVIVPLTKTVFMRQVLLGIEKAKEELSDMGAEILVYEISSLDVQDQLEAMNQLKSQGIQALAIAPVDDTLIRDRINEFVEKNIPVITFNTDIENSKRSAFVGMDNVNGGQTAAGLMSMLLQKTGRVAIIIGHLTNWTHSRRMEGFAQEIESSFPDIQITGVHACYDEDSVAEEITVKILHDTDIDGIYVAGAGQSGVCDAVEKLEMQGDVKIIAHDMIEKCVQGLQHGVIDFLIDQNAQEQGYRPIMLLFEMFFSNLKDIEEYQFTDTIIKTKYNI